MVERVVAASPLRDPSALGYEPLRRCVLLTDLVDSTALIERLDDGRVAALLQGLDQRLLAHLAHWRGRLIDKSDGVLVLFERVADGLGFAVDYLAALRELGADFQLDLQARIGIHVGTVLTWSHSPAEVLAGCKPLEVEGIVKPVAARLMRLALPGQILLSDAAVMAARAERTDGVSEPTVDLCWQAHGRYRLKGVSGTLTVYEVGAVGVAPLRAPPSSAAARRAFGKRAWLLFAALLIGAVAALGHYLRSPTLDFAARDWVVLADLDSDGALAYPQGLDAALRIGLQQSRHVNVLSQARVHAGLQRMRRDAARLDRQTAIELALREGAKAVIVPTLSRAGAQLRLSVEVVDPSRGQTVYARSGLATDAAELLPELDRLLAGLRVELGETLASVADSSRPLEQVTTADLAALQAFSQAQRAIVLGQLEPARAGFAAAVQSDGEFAMGWLGLARVHFALADPARAVEFAARADALPHRLSEREAGYLRATVANIQWHPRHGEAWCELSDRYPDFHSAASNCAHAAFRHNQFGQMLRYSERIATPHSDFQATAALRRGQAALADERIDDALAQFAQMRAAGLREPGLHEAIAYAAKRDFAVAAEWLGRYPVESALLQEARSDFAVILQLDQGDWRQARQRIDADRTANGSELSAAILLLNWATAADGEFAARLDAYTAAAAAAIDSSDGQRRERAQMQGLYAAYLGVGDGDPRLGEQALQRVAQTPIEQRSRLVERMAELLRARQELRAGQPHAAIERLQAQLDGAELYLTHALLADALAEVGQSAAALRHAQWLLGHRGWAYLEWSAGGVLRGENLLQANLALLRAAQLTARLGQAAPAAAYQTQFQQRWPDLAAAARIQALALGAAPERVSKAP